MEQPVKPNAVNYKNQPGRIENYTPGKSSISDKEAKQVNASIFNFRLQSIEFFFITTTSTTITVIMIIIMLERTKTFLFLYSLVH
jgi:hypothetical protein